MNNNYVVFDIDGTLANCDHRMHYIQTKPKNWNAFFDELDKDTVIEGTRFILDQLYNHAAIIICTGRKFEYTEKTKKWLKANDIYYDKLLTRKKDDYREDTLVKVDQLKELIAMYGCKPLIWFDDRERVCQALRAQGVLVAQVADGKY